MKSLKLMQLNAENLVINWDKKSPPEDLTVCSETQWQSLSGINYPNKELLKIQALADSILDESPDVVAIVEVMGITSLKNFNDRFLNNQYTIFYTNTNSNRGIDMGFLVKKNIPFRMEVQTHNKLKVMLNNNFVAKFSRGVSELRLINNKDRIEFIFLLVHLKSQISSKQDLNGFEQRRAEIVSLMDLYQQVEEQNPEAKIVLTGDFNGWAGALNPDEEFKVVYEKTKLKDMHDLLNSNLMDRSSHVFFNFLGEAQLNQLDYIFLNTKAQSAVVKENCYCYRYKYFGYPWPLPKTLEEKRSLPSDHYPQIALLSLEDVDE